MIYSIERRLAKSGNISIGKYTLIYIAAYQHDTTSYNKNKPSAVNIIVMQWTDRIRQVKIILVIVAIVIAVVSLVASNILTKDLAREERSQRWKLMGRSYARIKSSR